MDEETKDLTSNRMLRGAKDETFNEDDEFEFKSSRIVGKPST